MHSTVAEISLLRPMRLELYSCVSYTLYIILIILYIWLLHIFILFYTCTLLASSERDLSYIRDGSKAPARACYHSLPSGLDDAKHSLPSKTNRMRHSYANLHRRPWLCLLCVLHNSRRIREWLCLLCVFHNSRRIREWLCLLCVFHNSRRIRERICLLCVSFTITGG